MILNTQSAQYQQYLTGLQAIIDFYKPKLVLFEKLPPAKKKLWLQRDPLFRKLLKMSFGLSEWASEFRTEVQND